jgi:D-glycero-D-manno-heptose 1,7-bisphosphate phosphatase
MSRFTPAVFQQTEFYKKPVIGLDRDGTLNVDLGTYVTKPEDFHPIPGALEAVALMRRKGYPIVIITNQAGIMKNIMTPEQVDAVHQYMFELLGQAGCPSVDGLYYSTTNLKEDEFAKPNIGMFKKFENDTKYKIKNGFYVGDKMTDLKAATKAKMKPVLVKTGYGNETLQKLNTFSNRELKKKTKVFDSLYEFAESLP